MNENWTYIFAFALFFINVTDSHAAHFFLILQIFWHRGYIFDINQIGQFFLTLDMFRN